MAQQPEGMARRPRWAGDWEAAGGPLSSIQLLKSHDNERGQHFVPATGPGSLELERKVLGTRTGSLKREPRSETIPNTDSSASSSCSAAGSVTGKGDGGRLERATGEAFQRKPASRPSIPCTKGSKTLSTNTYSLLSQKALTLHHISSRPGHTNSFSSSAGLAARPGTFADRDELASAFFMAADSCINRVRLRRIKQALQRWRKHACTVSAVLADGAQRRRAKPTGLSRIRANAHTPFTSALGEDPAGNPASDGFDRSLELEGAAQIVSAPRPAT